MVLIFSIENDLSTKDVINWLTFFDKKFVRLNPEDKLIIQKFEILNSSNVFWEAKVGETVIKYSDITSVWYRRGGLNVFDFEIIRNSSLQYENYLEKEIETIENSFKHSLMKKNVIGNFVGVINKLIVLIEAQEVGLSIPNTSILTDKSKLKDFKQLKSLISKPIFEISPIEIRNKTAFYSAYTELLNENEVDESFFYTLVQEQIVKEFEIRSVYYNDVFYSSAIISQNNLKTSVDFRHYDEEKPNRILPYTLPTEIEIKLRLLMKKLRLNSGSFDLLYSENDYYFLEVNPVGQFGMVSFPCNYNIEKNIALKLI
jgi:ATP-GRASP peptide maturase of grasp-with-spasm system